MNFNGGQVSKAAGMVGLALALLSALRNESGASAPVAAAGLRVDAATVKASCASARGELRFQMLAPNEEPELTATRGLQVCLAVYRRSP